MQKKVVSSDEARKIVVQGVDKLADTIKATLGPKGRNVVIANAYTKPYITNDGATIAREFLLEDAFENVGIELVKEVALKTNDVAGDGTTTAIVLAQKMIHEGMEYIEAGYSPIRIKEGIQKAVEIAVRHVLESSIEIKTLSQIEDIARISSGEIEIGQIIASAFEKIGREAHISIEETKSTSTQLEIVQGYQIDEGYVSPYLLTDQTKLLADLKDPYFLITDEKITHMNQIVSILEKLIEINRNLVLISDVLQADVLSTLVLNKLQNILKIVAIKAPSTHEKRKEILEDIATITGGKVVGTQLGIPLEKVSLHELGKAKQVIVSKETTVIIGGQAKQLQLEQKKTQITKLLSTTTLDYEKDSLNIRLAKLSESAAIIKVGALSELEMKEKKMKIEDALCATRVAIQDGIVVGGGKAYLNTIKYLHNIARTLKKEEKIGFDILIQSLQEPILQLLRNAGVHDLSSTFSEIYKADTNIGYNINTSTFMDMLEAGIIDPTKVAIVALQSASSIASLLLTTESILVDVSQESVIKKELNEQLIQDSTEGLY